MASSQHEPGDHERGDGRNPPGDRQHGYRRGDRGYRDQYGQPDRETTLPLPVVDAPGAPDDPDAPEDPRGPGDREGSACRPWSARPRRRGHRFLYKAAMTIATLAACLLIGFGVLLLVTPSAGQATA
ncbi:MAG TPA: hypothetical protein VI365_23750, partial [Trebonia sp.]